jgi:hypothetical protein
MQKKIRTVKHKINKKRAALKSGRKAIASSKHKTADGIT